MTQQPGDRLVFFYMRKQEKGYRLAMTLWGNRANILLLNEEDRLLRSLKESHVKYR